jgi:hypothetical protein
MKDFIQKLVISIIIVFFNLGFNYFFPTPSIWHYFSVLLIILLCYYLFYSLWKKYFPDIRGKYIKYFPKIGVLNGSIKGPLREYKCERACTNVTPSMWFLALRKNINRIHYISTSHINNSYTMIINPFGDNFPEEDTKLHTTFYSICDYVNNGGIFVITGGAFFSHQNTFHSSNHEWVIIKTHEGVQSLNDSLLFQEFGIQTTGDSLVNGNIVATEPLKIEIYQKPNDQFFAGKLDLPKEIKRFRAATSKTSNYIPFITEKNGKSFPVILVRYGKGYIIHAGIFLESETSDEFKLIITIIDNLIKSKFKNL